MTVIADLSEIQIGDILLLPRDKGTDYELLVLDKLTRIGPEFSALDNWHPEAKEIVIIMTMGDTRQKIAEFFVLDLQDNIKKKRILGDFKKYFIIPGSDVDSELK